MQILMVEAGRARSTPISTFAVHRAFCLDGFVPFLYPKMHSYLDPETGVNLRFKEAENRKQRRRRTAGLFLGEAAGG